MNPLDWVTDAAGAVIGDAADTVLAAVVAWVDEALVYVAGEVASVLTSMSAPAFGSATFAQLGGTFKWLALVSVVATVMLSCAGALLNRRVEVVDVVREIPVTMVMLAGWYTVAAVWFEACRALTGVFVADALLQSFEAGLSLDVGIASLVRMMISLLMIVFLVVFLVEMFVLQHVLTIATVVGPLAISVRPWPGLRDVSGRMIRNVVAVSLTPALTAASMSLALQNVNEAGVLDIGQAIGGLAGMVVSVLMPVMINRFLPLGGSSDAGGRAVIGAAAGVTATVLSGGAAGMIGAAGAAGMAGSAGTAGANAARLASLTTPTQRDVAPAGGGQAAAVGSAAGSA